EALPRRLRGAPEADRPEEAVRVDDSGPQDLRQPSGSDPPLVLHLPEPVAGVRVTEAEERVGRAPRPDRRNAVRIGFDRHRRGEPGDLHGAAPARKGRGDEDEERGEHYRRETEDSEEDLPQR